MSSAAQISANRRNALRSTGPQSEQGKQASARNAISHGLCTREFVILDSDRAAFDELSSGLLADLQPAAPLEHELFRQLLHASWTLRRCRLAESVLLDSPIDPLSDPKHHAALKLIDTYARRAERAFQRSLKELRTLQTERLFRAQRLPEAVPLPVLVNHHTHKPKPSPKPRKLMLEGIPLSPEAYSEAQSYINYIMAPLPEIPPPSLQNKRTQSREGARTR